MAASSLAGGLSIISHEPAVLIPAKSHERGPSVEELDSIELPHYGLVKDAVGAAPTGKQQPWTPTPLPEDRDRLKDLEASPPQSPICESATNIAPSFWYPAMNRWRVLACCLIYFGNGINDAVNGALIPSMETHYGIGYAIVSLIFVANACGFLLAAPTSNIIANTLGRAKTLMLSETVILSGYIIVVCTPPFPVVVVAYLLLGFGVALNLALNNVFCANLANSTVVLGAAHGSYGVGGIVAPIMATAMVSNGILWSRFFLITIGLRIACLVFAGWAFWTYESERINESQNNILSRHSSNRSATAEPSKVHLLLRALNNRTTLMGASFIFFYQGSEVSESGWFISYLLDYRHGDPRKVGYVTAGFWAGITLGRFTLTHLASRAGEKSFVFALTTGAVALQLLAWLVPNIVGGAVAVSVLGFLLGPAYPCATTVFARLLPADLQMTAIAFITTAGSSGGAVLPLVTGVLAQAVGTYVLHPICIVSFVLMLGCWVWLPRIVKRTE